MHLGLSYGIVSQAVHERKMPCTACREEAMAMWRNIVAHSQARKASRNAIARLRPLVEDSRRRLYGIADAAWSDPYIIGLVMTMITIIARLESPVLDGALLCHVQTKAWTKITGTNPGLVGEDVMTHSAARQPDFELGRRHALELVRCFYCGAGNNTAGNIVLSNILAVQKHERRFKRDELPDDQNYFSADIDNAAVAALWMAYFDARCESISRGGLN